MLQQGLFVADLAYLLNEGAPSTPPIWGPGTQPAPPEGYDYDFVNADVLLNRMSVADDGRLVLPDGMSYRVLVLPETDRMRPELLRKIRELVPGGATVVGPKPTRSPSLANYPAADDEVRALAADLWGDLDGVEPHHPPRRARAASSGAGRSTRGRWRLAKDSIRQADFDYASRGAATPMLAWLAPPHRSDADIYYVANLTDRRADVRRALPRRRPRGRDSGTPTPA